MKRTYNTIQIRHFLPNWNKEIDKILGIKSNNSLKEIWRYKKIEYENEPPVFFINFVYELLKNKMEVLEKELGIKP